MAEPRGSRLWAMRTGFVLIALVIIFFQLLPLETTPRRWAGPDLLLAITLAWTIRRPSYVPVLSVAAVMLLADLMFQRPPGLWAGLVVIACEWLRRRSRGLRDSSFMAEWGTVALAVAALSTVYRLVLALTVTPAAPLGLTAIQMMMTLAVYPLIVLISHVAFGLRRARPGEATGLGQRP